jgi:ubiquitin carboxyl-terminal hydrolase 7
MDDVDAQPSSGDTLPEEAQLFPPDLFDDPHYARTIFVLNDMTKKSEQNGVAQETEEFMIGANRWKLIFFFGKVEGFFSLYLKYVSDSAEYRVPARFRFRVKNHLSKTRGPLTASHTFSQNCVDWGFTHLLKLSEMNDPSGGDLKNDALHVYIETYILEVPAKIDIGSVRKTTGCVGTAKPKEDEAGVVAPLLQSLFHLPALRGAVFQMPLKNNGGSEDETAILTALQSVFYRLQKSELPVAIEEFTRAFDWKTSVGDEDILLCGAVSRLNQFLTQQAKGTAQETVIQRFHGDIRHSIKCIDVNYVSSRVEVYSDLQLPIEGCKDVYESFQKYTAPEMLNGDNKYVTEGFGRQSAVKSVEFLSFPDVLILTFPRSRSKTQRFEYSPVLDLKNFCADKESKETPIYRLSSVIVRESSCGVFLRRTLDSPFCSLGKTVKEVPDWYVFGNNFGLIDDGSLRSKSTTYPLVLVYVRQSAEKEIFRPVTEHQILSVPEIVRLQADAEMEQQLFMFDSREMVVVTKEMLLEDKQEARDMLPKMHGDEEGEKSVPRTYAKKTWTLRKWGEDYAISKGLDPKKVRLWGWINRKNKTSRVELPFTPKELDEPLSELQKDETPLRIFVEVSEREEGLPPLSSTTCAIFFKYFDIDTGELRHIGYDFFDKSATVESLLPVAKKMAGISEDEPVHLREEVRPGRYDFMPLQKDLKQSEIVTGDIVVVEKYSTVESIAKIDSPYLLQRAKFRRTGDGVLYFADESSLQATHLTCPICSCPLRDPVSPACSHLFCKECVEKWKQENNSCPTCRGPVDLLIPSLLAKTLLDEAEFFCPSKEKGCHWVGKGKNLEEHLNADCPDGTGECNLCHTALTFENHEGHTTTCFCFLCPFAPACNWSGQGRVSLLTNHIAVCQHRN